MLIVQASDQKRLGATYLSTTFGLNTYENVEIGVKLHRTENLKRD